MSSENKDSIQMLFPTVVQVSQLDNYVHLNESIMQAIDEVRSVEKNTKPQSWACEVYTTIGNPQALLKHPSIQSFLTIAREKIINYAKSMNYVIGPESPRITECWLNAYQTGHSQEIHIHRNNVFSGIYYVKVPEGSGATLFYSPQADSMLEPMISEGNNLNAKVSGFPAVEGRMMIFRSSLRHSVLPSKNMQGERITVAFNAVV